MVRPFKLGLFLILIVICFTTPNRASPILHKAVVSDPLKSPVKAGFISPKDLASSRELLPNGNDHLQKRSGRGTYKDRVSLNPGQQRRLERNESQRRRAQELAAAPALSDEEVLDKIAQKERDHFAQAQNPIKVGDEEKHEELQEKWTSRRKGIHQKDQNVMLNNYRHYQRKENDDRYSVLKRTEAKRLKEYYKSKLFTDPEAGQSSSAAAGSVRVMSPAQVPGTPAGGHYYGSSPSSPYFNPDQYHPGNWGDGRGYQ